MKRKIGNKEIMDNLLDAYFEVLNQDENEVKEVLSQKFNNIEDFDNSTNLFISKLLRDATIKAEKKKSEELNIYKQLKEFVNSLKNCDDYIKENFSSDEMKELELAHRNFSGASDDSLKKEFIILKLMSQSSNNNKK